MYKVIWLCCSPAGTYRRAVKLQPGASLSWPSDTSLKLRGSELFVLLKELPRSWYRAFAATGDGGGGGYYFPSVLPALAEQLLPAV